MLKIIAAVSENGVIGKEGKIPWKLRDDMLWFKEVTAHHPVVMGRKTYNSIIERLHRPLPGRENIVLTRNPHTLRCDGVTPTNSWEEVLERAEKEDVFVIGGSDVYAMALPHARKMYITHVEAKVEGDAFFPAWNPDEWDGAPRPPHPADEKNEYPYVIACYERERNTFIEMTNCRSDKQREEMGLILHRNHCPFCTEHLKKYHDGAILWEGIHWRVSFNDYPYPWAGIHLIAFLKDHATHVDEIVPDAFREIGDVLAWAKRKYDMPGLGFFLRAGDCRWTGGTIRHIHAHIVTRKTLNDEAGKFYLG